MRTRAPYGFTMVEVMTVLGIVGVLAGLSAVGFSRLKSRVTIIIRVGRSINTNQRLPRGSSRSAL